MASIGSPDTVTDVLKPSQLKDMAVFMGDVEQADGRESLPAWPDSIGYLSGAKVLYGHDRKYLSLVYHYCKAVMAKVERLALFYAQTHEIHAEEDGPSPEAIAKYSNVAACGGAYYVNQGKPTGSVKTNTLDWKQDDEFPDDVCNKKVVWGGAVGTAPYVHSHRFLPILTPLALSLLQKDSAFTKKGSTGIMICMCQCGVIRGFHLMKQESMFAIVAPRYHSNCVISVCLFLCSCFLRRSPTCVCRSEALLCQRARRCRLRADILRLRLLAV